MKSSVQKQIADREFIELDKENIKPNIVLKTNQTPTKTKARQTKGRHQKKQDSSKKKEHTFPSLKVELQAQDSSKCSTPNTTYMFQSYVKRKSRPLFSDQLREKSYVMTVENTKSLQSAFVPTSI